MTKKQSTSLSPLAELKMAVITYHKGNEYVYMRSQIARDACYTSHNSLTYKRGQMADIKAEIVGLHEASGSEVVDVKIERKVMIYQGMEAELEELTERHNADLEVYKAVTGDNWTPRPKRTHKSDGLGIDSTLKRILAA